MNGVDQRGGSVVERRVDALGLTTIDWKPQITRQREELGRTVFLKPQNHEGVGSLAGNWSFPLIAPNDETSVGCLAVDAITGVRTHEQQVHAIDR